MNKIISTEKIPIKLWLDDIEPRALEQAKHLANLPIAYHHIAIMADAHEGYGMPIGGILATKNHIVPNAVGVDIGCGMCAVRTPFKSIQHSELSLIMAGIRNLIPMGFSHHKKPEQESAMPSLEPILSLETKTIVQNEYERALTQIGTLGGGNHFIDIHQGSDGFIWIMVHSGSRNIGFQVANHYNRVAVKYDANYAIPIPHSWDLAYIPVESSEGMCYITEMTYCVDFALANRKLIMERIIEVISDIKKTDPSEYGEIINIAHNYARKEYHFGSQVYIHRKGATLAMQDTIGIIPGSMGTSSYIVQGLGNPESFESCSHGAGRKLSRHKAIKTLSLTEEIKLLESKDILHGIRTQRALDEAPGAYKDIQTVMENQKDLVKILYELKPLAVLNAM